MNLSVRVDVWEGNSYVLDSINNPTDQEAIRMLSRLDGTKSTILCVELENKNEFIIGGGPDFFVIYSAASDESINEFSYDKSLTGKTSLLIGGQEGNFENSMLFPRKEAEKLLINFLSESRHLIVKSTASELATPK